MLLDLIYVFGGFALLLWGADRFVIGAAATASILGVPPMLIGLTIVGFATSAPEIMVSISAANSGLTSMALGNAIGSNIANIGLVLGACALIRPISGELSGTLGKELPVLVLLTPLTLIFFLDDRITRIEATVLLTGLVIFLAWMTRLGLSLSAAADPSIQEISDEIPQDMAPGWACLWIAVGFATLLVGAELLVAGAESIAQRYGLSELVIGLTIIAIGTSLPELAISVVAAIKGNTGIAVGNVIGSNFFNLLAVMGIAGWISPTDLDISIRTIHYPVMIAFTVPLLLLAYNPIGNKGLSRGMGFVLVLAFCAYQAFLLSQA
jgi:cation:H+ antiporter